MSIDDRRSRPPLVILDRDGVINQDSDAYIKSPEEWIPIPGSLEAIARLNHAGILVAVASNQSGLGRGLFDLDTLNAMHAKYRDDGLVIIGVNLDKDNDSAADFLREFPADFKIIYDPEAGGAGPAQTNLWRGFRVNQ